MLRELQISNVAIIEQQTICFGPGLNVLSGETGSGKSIVLHAIEFLLGARPRPHFIHAGTEEAEVQALFEMSDATPEARRAVQELVGGDEFTLCRSLNSAGRSRVYINGKMGTLATLSELASKVVNICGQHQHVRLLEPASHREFLDGFAGAEQQVEKLSRLYREMKETARRLRDLEEGSQRAARRRAELEFIVEELSKVELEPGTRARLEAEVKLLSRAGDIVQGLASARDFIGSEGGINEQLGRLEALLADVAVKFDSVSPLLREARDISAAAEDLLRKIDKAAQSVELNPELLDQRREELAEIARLERKYRLNDEALCALLQSARAELSGVGEESDVSELRAKLSQLEFACQELAREITKIRERGARKLEKAVEGELAELAMQTKFRVSLEPDDLSTFGCDRVEMLIAPNPGTPALPLREIASGGELARITLVLKKLLREKSGVNVLVFDEVDSGISGGVARAVGEKLKDLAKLSQVICITHLPQVASLAQHHFLVGKRAGKRTVSVIRELSGEEKIEEIARMLAGYQVTAASRESARELLSSKSSGLSGGK
ncbi:MAG: DNA repair protein RecN [Oligoflexia bacterium]|nr:DNA repair protein RecN [Oligoflexia bacterium]